MWQDATDFNEKAESVDLETKTTTLAENETSNLKGVEISPYDRCGAEIGLGVESTKWSTILAFNSVLYLCLAVFTVICFIGATCQPLICGAVLGHCCGGCAQFICIIMTGAYRYSEQGEACAENPDFSDHADKIQQLFVS